MLANLTEAQLNVAWENECEQLDEVLNPDEPDFSDIGFGRRKRQATMRPFTDDVINLAIANENACNPVLRTSARATLEE